MRLPPDDVPSALPFRDENGRLLAELSHEIRTPLTAMLGYAELLLDQNQDAALLPESREALAVIHANSQHLLNLVNSILDWSRLDAGAPLRRSFIDPIALTEEVVCLLRVRAGAVPIRVIIDPYTPRLVATDPVSLRQILFNLLGNALKFTSHGEVRVELTGLSGGALSPGLEIRISDTGIGMTPAQIARLFRPFSQGDDQVRSSYGGTGLGLAISHRLCQQLDGELSVESRPGEGSCFRVKLPCGNEIPAMGNPSRSVVKQEVLAGKHILLADDCQDTRRLHVRFLRSAGAHVTETCNGHEALLAAQRVDAAQPDIIVLDSEMPVCDGLETAQALRSAGYFGPLIALTATDSVEHREACQTAGFDDYAVKPIALPAFLQVLSRALDLSGADNSDGDLGIPAAMPSFT